MANPDEFIQHIGGTFLSQFIWFCTSNLQLHNLNNSDQKIQTTKQNLYKYL